MDIIREFRGAYRWLSNFWYVPIEYEGMIYPTTEHAYQAAKTKDIHDRILISELPTPRLARQAGQTLDIRPDWEEIKIDVMMEVTRKKFEDSLLRTALLSTGDAILQEGNTWGDVFWGIDLCTETGQNNLGKILMQVRDEIRRKE